MKSLKTRFLQIKQVWGIREIQKKVFLCCTQLNVQFMACLHTTSGSPILVET